MESRGDWGPVQMPKREDDPWKRLEFDQDLYERTWGPLRGDHLDPNTRRVGEAYLASRTRQRRLDEQSQAARGARGQHPEYGTEVTQPGHGPDEFDDHVGADGERLGGPSATEFLLPRLRIRDLQNPLHDEDPPGKKE